MFYPSNLNFICVHILLNKMANIEKKRKAACLGLSYELLKKDNFKL